MFPSRIASVLGGGAGLQNNYSLSLDGTNDFVDCGTSLGTALGDNYAGSLSVSMWFKNGGANDDGLLDIGPGTGAGEFFISLGSSSKLYFNLNAGGWSRSVTFTDTSSWHHLGCVYTVGSESDSLLYLDGVSVGGTTGTFPSASDMVFGTNNELVIGNFWDRSSYHFVGNIDEVSIWNKALSAGDISALYQAKGTANLNDDGNSASLQGWWRMGDGRLDDFGTANGLITDQVNPTLGSELWDSPASVFTSGTYAWTAYGSNTIENDSNTLKATYVDNSGLAKIFFSDAKDLSADLVVGTTYKLQMDIKANTGTIRITIRGLDTVVDDFTNTAFETKTYYFVASHATEDYLKVGNGSSGQIAYVDNMSLKVVNGNAGIMTNMDAVDIVKDTP